VRGIKVTGWGISVPDKVVTNDDLSARLDTSDAWITERTGIRERHVGGTTSEMAIEAGRRALERAGVDAGEIEMVVLATTTPDALVPGTACTVQAALGTTGGAMDLNAACSGFVYGLVVASGLIATGAGRTLLIGADALSRITDWDDRKMAVLVGDGGGAVVLEPVDGPGDLLSWNLNADGSLRHLLTCDHGGYLAMDGKEVFRRAVRVVVESAQRALGLRLKSYILLPTWGEPPFYSLLVESGDLGDDGICDRFADRLEEELQAQNVEYTSKRETLRLAPVRIRRIPDGSWGEFQKRRLAKSGGTVEQYKQPHLIPDLAEISSFRLLDADSVASSGSA